MKLLSQYIVRLKQKKSITLLDITLFLRQFATLIAAGIPLIQCCDILEKSQHKTAMRILVYTIKREILAGNPLFQSLSQHKTVFDELTCQLIRVGEATGKLDKMLLIIARYQENKLAFRQRIKQALFYPCLISIAALFMTLGLFIFVIPRFADLFQDKLDQLPNLTLWIFYLSHLFQQGSGASLIAIILLLLLIFHSPYSRLIKNYLYQTIMTLPWIKSCMQKMILARFARNLALALNAGIPIIDSLSLTTHLYNNTEFSLLITKLRSKINAGLPLHQVMALFPYFPPLMVQMVKMGEESGKLEALLDKTADFFESDIDQLISQLNQLLEPLIMGVLGVLIGGLVISMYLPIFKVGSAL